MTDDSFSYCESGLQLALAALARDVGTAAVADLPAHLPEIGVGEQTTLEQLAPIILGGARRLGAPTAFAHMDPPTPWIAWATTLWNAALNQNLLHPDVAPVARDIEARVIDWLSPSFGMQGGHMTPGSTISNLTALWAARERKGIRCVVASEAAHLSVGKAAHILGLDFVRIAQDCDGRIDPGHLPKDLSNAALVLTAGSTSAGVIDPLDVAHNAAWLHVDAAWAGPLLLSTRHRDKLAGLENADSVAVSAHKWLFQPKESGLVLFRDTDAAKEAVSFAADYLAVPNVGVLGSHGATAVPLLATLLCWGKTGLAERLDRAMEMADQLHRFLTSQPNVELFGPNQTGVILWRSSLGIEPQVILAELPDDAASTTQIGPRCWIRHVAANPNVDINRLTGALGSALQKLH